MDDLRMRLGTVGIVVAALFATLFTRLVWLQTVASDEFAARADTIPQRTAVIPTKRGRVFDRNGVLLVDNQMTIVVTIDKRVLTARLRPPVLSRLSRWLEVPYVTLEQRLDDRDNNELFPIPVAKGVKETAAVYIVEHDELFPGVDVTVQSERVYPNGDVAAHVLGFVGRVTDPATLPRALRYQGNDLIGKDGIELSYETTLRGKPGLDLYTVDRRQRIRSTTRVAEPVPGKDVYLTIDVELQRTCESSLAQGLKEARQDTYHYRGKDRRYKAPGGAIVLLDVLDGTIGCMASLPSYSPTDFTINRNNARIEQLLEDRNGPLNNRALVGLYPPASTFKLVTALAALQDGLITPRTTYEDTGEFRLESCRNEVLRRCVFYNAGRTPHGRVDLQRALTVSSDVFFDWIGERLWIEDGRDRLAMQKAARGLGFGQRTGVRLPNEPIGRIPDADTKAKLYARNKRFYTDPNWRTGDNINMSIGQGLVVATPLQMARAYATFLNGGVLLEPRIAYDGVSPVTAAAAAETAASSGVSSTVASTVASSVASASSTSTTSVTDTTGATGTSEADGESGPTSPISDSVAAVLARPPLRATVAGHYDIPEEFREPIAQGLAGVVREEQGTAYDAFEGFPLDRFPLAGKTGTAQVTGKGDYALFVGYGPSPDPRYVVVVVMEESGFGGQAAAPVARRVFEKLIGLSPADVKRQTEQRND